MSDRAGRRKRYVSIGYIIWGVTTIIFGLTEYVRTSLPMLPVSFLGFLVLPTIGHVSYACSVTATPFRRPHQFYLNYKENYYRADGFARFGDLAVSLDGASGLLAFIEHAVNRW